MKKLLCLFVVPFALAFSQAPIKKDLFYLFSKVPAPPDSAAQAYKRSDPTGSGEGGDGSIGKRFSALSEEIQKLREEISVPSGAADIMKKAQSDPEKMGKMTDEEKMKMAQEMMKGMQSDPREVHLTPEVQEAMSKYSELLDAMGDRQDGLRYRQMMEDRWTQLSKKFGEIDGRTNKAILQRFPHAFESGASSMSEAEMKVSDTGVRRMRLQAWNAEKNPCLNKEFSAVRIDMEKRAAFLKGRFKPFNDALRKADFGSGATDQTTKQAFGSGQIEMISSIEELLETSRRAWTGGADYFSEKVKLLKQ